MSSYNIIEAPYERVRRVLLTRFTTAIQQRAAIGRVAGLGYECRLTPEIVTRFAQGWPDTEPNQQTAIVAIIDYLELRGDWPAGLEEARRLTGHPVQQEADLSITYQRHQPPPEPDRSWDFLQTGEGRE